MSDQNIFISSPNWCANAVATSQGWANSVSGEVLVQVGNNFTQRTEYTTYHPVDIPGSLDFSNSLNSVNFMLLIG